MAESSRSRLREYQLGADGVERLRGELKEAVVKLWPAGREQDERYMAVNTLCNLALRLLHSETGKREHHSVWAVQNKTSVILFSTEQAAKDFVATFPASVSGGMEITQMGVV
jgi:hypothetical protein